jgi:hypothetical protein
MSQTERPGPGDYEIAKSNAKNFAQPSSVFASRVQRTGIGIGTSSSNVGLRSQTALTGTSYKGIGTKSMV